MDRRPGKYLAILLLAISSTCVGAAEVEKPVPEAVPVINSNLQYLPPIPQEMLLSTYKVRSTALINGEMLRAMGSAVGADLSGYGIEGKRYLLTAAHVVSEGGGPCENVEVEIKNPKFKARVWVKADIIAYDTIIDIAIIRVGIDLPYLAPIATADDINVGEWLMAVGCPSGLGVTPTLGVMVSKDPEGAAISPDNYEGSMSIYYGNSGGPVWDVKRMNVIGIAVAGVGSRGLAANVAIFVSQPAMARFLRSSGVKDRLADGGYPDVAKPRDGGKGNKKPDDKDKKDKKDKKDEKKNHTDFVGIGSDKSRIEAILCR